MFPPILIYFFIFIILGLLLNVTKKYDLITISVVYVIAALFFYFIDIYAVIYLILFFGIAESVTYLFDKEHKKRNYSNIFGNCLASIIFLILGFALTFIYPYILTFFVVAALAAISCAFSDTLSSEIGRLSEKTPILINNLQKAERGTEGAITFLGIAAAALGSLITGAFFWLVSTRLTVSMVYSTKIIIIIAVCGVIGSVVDSFIGAIIERRGYINNNHTNFIATLLTGIIAMLLMCL